MQTSIQPLQQVRALLMDAAERGIRYWETLESRPVAPGPAAVQDLAQLNHAMPSAPSDPSETLALLDRIVGPATVSTIGGRYFGFVNGGALPVALASHWLAAAWDQNVALRVMAPGVAAVEDVALQWVLDLLGLPAGATGTFLTGASMANFTGLAAARHAVLRRVGWDAEADGLFGAPPITVVVGEEAHSTLLRALSLVGFGCRRVLTVPTDGQGRMDVSLLPVIQGPAVVCIQAGNVNSGAFDPADAICDWAHQRGAWVHVDGAFGLWAAAAPRRAHLAAGFEKADSWATDAHKWLNVPYDCGIALVRDPAALRGAMAMSGAYLQQDAQRVPMQYTPDLSRRARAVDVWAALRALGRSGVADMIERTCTHATNFANGLRESGFRVLNDVVINQVLVSFGDEATTRRVIDAIQADGTCWCGGTTWKGEAAMRISISSWATSERDVQQSLAAIRRIVTRVSA